MKNKKHTRTLLVRAAILSCALFRSVAAGTDGSELRRLAEQSLPGARLLPAAPARPRLMMAASGDGLDLMSALQENPAPRKGAGYWSTPTMRYLGRQRIAVTNTNEAAGVIRLLQALTRGPSFVKQNIYRARAVDGGWVVEVEHDSFAESAAAMPPYELLLDAGQRVTQIRERCYAYAGSPSVYDHTVRAVYAREIKLNGGINYEAMVEQELAKEWAQERAQKAVK